jgi:hypothetical protein
MAGVTSLVLKLLNLSQHVLKLYVTLSLERGGGKEIDLYAVHIIYCVLDTRSFAMPW